MPAGIFWETTLPVSNLSLSTFSTVIFLNPSFDAFLFTLSSSIPTKLGISTVFLPDETRKSTFDPFLTFLPALGSLSITVFSFTSSLATSVISPTSKPALTIVTFASSKVLLRTSGAETLLAPNK